MGFAEDRRAEGYSIVCCTCKKLQEGLAQSLGSCTQSTDCKSPLFEGDFHEYEGPISDFSRHCFVCGAPPTKAVRIRGKVRVFGICDDHVRMFHGRAITGPESGMKSSDLYTSSGFKPFEQVLKPSYSLGQLITDLNKK